MGWPWGIDTIPSGWHLCDGNAGTPDYRGRYLVGAGDEHAPGDNVGQDSQTHAFTGDGHAHSLQSGTKFLDSFPSGDYGTLLTTEPAAGTTDSADNRPLSKAICWIMKL